jgi:hypothetical protein
MDILAGKEKIQERVDGAKARAGVLPEIDSVGVLANNSLALGNFPPRNIHGVMQIDFGFKGDF